MPETIFLHLHLCLRDGTNNTDIGQQDRLNIFV